MGGISRGGWGMGGIGRGGLGAGAFARSSPRGFMGRGMVGRQAFAAPRSYWKGGRYWRHGRWHGKRFFRRGVPIVAPFFYDDYYYGGGYTGSCYWNCRNLGYGPGYCRAYAYNFCD
ncbi:MAG: hypothetical protein HY765_09320 [Rhodomicrobium sp.]|nr:hypothetical protein [Rhodomicrobium sp.]